MSFTEGPWFAVDVDEMGLTIVDTGRLDDNYICRAETDNARLIAAAPDLLEACEKALEVINQNIPNETEVAVPGIGPLLRAAITKAKGES